MHFGSESDLIVDGNGVIKMDLSWTAFPQAKKWMYTFLNFEKYFITLAAFCSFEINP